jgi:hypothetical protein
MTDVINLQKKKRYILAHGFNPWSLGLVGFGPVERQYRREKAYNKGSCFGQEAKESERKRL